MNSASWRCRGVAGYTLTWMGARMSAPHCRGRICKPTAPAAALHFEITGVTCPVMPRICPAQAGEPSACGETADSARFQTVHPR
jgi:hypothetical protein